MKKELNVRIHFFLTCLLAFLIPILPAVIPVTIALLTINWIAGGNFLNVLRKKNDWFYFSLFISLYSVYLVGMLWSENLKYGMKDLETKSSLLIFPFIYFFNEKINKQQLTTVLLSFIYGCLAASVICLGYATYQYAYTHYLLANNIRAWDYGINFFLKERLSIWMHPSYRSMYFVMALAGLHWVRDEKFASSVWKKYVIPVALSFFVLLFSSKAGMLSLLMWGIFKSRHLVLEGKIKPVVIGAVSATCMFFALYFCAPQFALRINSTIHTLSENTNKKNSEESTAVRMSVWEAACKVITQNLPIGTGTGDVKDELLKEYESREMTFAIKERLNAHNQFLQTFAALGIPGVILLCSGLLVPLVREWKKKNYVFVIFIFLITLNLAAESMLETQAGVIFYAFFNSLLLRSEKEKL